MDHTTQEASTVYCGVTCAFAGTIPCGEKIRQSAQRDQRGHDRPSIH